MPYARLGVGLVLAVSLLNLSSAVAETHWDFQAVDAAGGSAWTPGYPLSVTGVILNNPEDMLDAAWDPNAEADGTMGGQWQIFVQGETPDRCGTALWMGQNYYSRVPVGDPATRRYGETSWNEEMDRLNHDPDSGHHFRRGDRVVITSDTSLFFGGKRNINEAHLVSNDFSIELLEANVGLPEPEELTLADLDASSGAPGYDAAYPRFDRNRETGAEHYQGMYVRMNELTLTDASGWGASGWHDRVCFAADGDGRELRLRMPLSDLGAVPTGEFDAYGIINQESGSMNEGRDGYELFVTEIVPEPAGLSLLAIGAMACLRRRRK